MGPPTCCTLSNNKLYTCFYSIFLLETFLLSTGDKNQGNPALSLQLAGLVARIPSFHPGCPGSISEQNIKLSLQAITPRCLSEVSPSLGQLPTGTFLHSSENKGILFSDWIFALEVNKAWPICISLLLY